MMNMIPVGNKQWFMISGTNQHDAENIESRYYYSQWVYAMFAFSALGTLLSFFYYNVFGKADRCTKIFMGDTGSLTLGYMLAFLMISYATVNPQIHPYFEGAIIVNT